MEAFSFLQPLPEELIAFAKSLENGTIGSTLDFYQELQQENWSPYHIALVSVTAYAESTCVNPDFYRSVRKDFYALFKGNWTKKMIDLGNIPEGNQLSDTFFVLKNIQRALMRKQIILIILGGNQAITYAQYRAYDQYKYMVNLVSVDARYDIGDAEQPIQATSYVSHMIVNKPYNLFNFSNIGYQTYYVRQEEKDLVEKLFFEAYRLGEATQNISEMEPVLRDADMLSLDFESIKASEVILRNHEMVNGFTAQELCALARYAGLSDKNTSFGIYHLEKMPNTKSVSQSAAQIIWYYLEGVNFRIKENPSTHNSRFLHYKVPINDEVINFYESEISGRWWVEIPQFSTKNNKLSEVSFLPCSKADYLYACDQNYPDRWFRAKCKNEL